MIKSALHRTVLHIERGVDRLRGQSDHRRIIEPYIGYATPEHLVVRGRVLTALRRNKAKPTQSKWINFLQMLSLFATDEVAAVKVTAGPVSALTDEEGYFTLLVPRNHDSGWASIDVHVADEAVAKPCPVLVPGPDAAFGVISDIDDTMLEPGAYSLSRNLWTSLTGNALTRHVFPDAVRFMDHLSQSERTVLAAFSRIYEVVSHPRCANCHVGPDNLPIWFGAEGEPPAQPHGMNIDGGDSRDGSGFLPCATCHRVSEDFESEPHAPPRAGVAWELAPVEMQWVDRTEAQVCAQLSDPERTGGRDVMGLVEHLVEDAAHHGLVLWGFAPSGGRVPAPYGLQAHVDDVLACGAAGQPCPEE